jgi:hypothetical protein
MDRHGPLEDVVGHARMHYVDHAMDRLVAAGAQNCRAEDLARLRIGDDLYEAQRLAFSMARPTRLMGRLPTSSGRPLAPRCRRGRAEQGPKTGVM